MKLLKFEYLFSFVLLIVLSVALFMFRDNNDLVMIFATALVSGFTAITTFFFTKYQANKEQ